MSNKQVQFESQDDKVSRKSLRSIANSKYSNQYNVAKIFGSKQRISQTQQEKIGQSYRDLQQGTITPHQFQQQIQQELKLQTRPNLEKQLKNVDQSYKDILSGIDNQEEIHRYLLKPNTYDPQILSQNQDKIQSLLKLQQERADQLQYNSQNQKQIQSLDLANQLLRGQITQKQFVKDIQNLGIKSSELNRNLKDLESANDTQKSKLGARLLRALEYQTDDQHLSYYNSGYTPDKSKLNDKHIIHSSIGTFVAAKQSTEQEQDEWIKTKQNRTMNGSLAYNQMLKQGEFSDNNKHSGDFLKWAYQQHESEQHRPNLSMKRHELSLKNSMNSKMEVVEDEILPKKSSNVSLFRNEYDFLKSDSQFKPIQKVSSSYSEASQKQLRGNGNIISWDQ